MGELFTYADAVEHAIDFLGGTPDALAMRDARRAVQAAYRELVNSRIWSYLYNHDRVQLNAAVSAGYIAYDQDTRYVHLYNATWPIWAGPGCKIRVGTVTSDVQERVSDTILTMTAQVNWGSDFDYDPVAISALTVATPLVITSVDHGRETGDVVIIEGMLAVTTGLALPQVNAAWTITVIDDDTFSLDGSTIAGMGGVVWDGNSGTWRLAPSTPYTLYQDDYLLPEDFIKSDTALYEGNFGGLIFREPTEDLWYNRFTYSAGTPRFYTIRGNTLFLGRLTICFWPYPDIARTIDFIYQRRSRSLRWEAYTTGTVTLTDGSTTVIGNGTTFSSSMVGSVLRVGTRTIAPTSWVSTAPPIQELQIAEVVSETELRLLEAAQAATTVLYAISDPVDIEMGVMKTAFLRGVEKQIAIQRHMTFERPQEDPRIQYDLALREAQAADSRSYQGRVMGAQRSRAVAAKYMPANFWPSTG